jgi:hypothetical protein
MATAYRNKLRKIAGMYKRTQLAQRSSQRKAYANFLSGLKRVTPKKTRKAPVYRNPLKVGQNNKGRPVYSGPKGGMFIVLKGRKVYRFPGYTKFR